MCISQGLLTVNMKLSVNITQGLPKWFSGKECLPILEIQLQSLHWDVPLEEEIATHSSILALKIPWTKGHGRLQSMGLERVRYD